MSKLKKRTSPFTSDQGPKVHHFTRGHVTSGLEHWHQTLPAVPRLSPGQEGNPFDERLKLPTARLSVSGLQIFGENLSWSCHKEVFILKDNVTQHSENTVGYPDVLH